MRSFIDCAIEDEHNLILEGWQLLPRLLAEIPLAERSGNVQIVYLYKMSVQDIVSGLKANSPINDWVLKHTRKEGGFTRIAQMISCFGQAIERDARELGFKTVNMDRDFAGKIIDLTDDLLAGGPA